MSLFMNIHKNLKITKKKRAGILRPEIHSSAPFYAQSSCCFSSHFHLRQGGDAFLSQQITGYSIYIIMVLSERKLCSTIIPQFITEIFFFIRKYIKWPVTLVPLLCNCESLAKLCSEAYFYKWWEVTGVSCYLSGLCQFHNWKWCCHDHSKGRWWWSAGFR